MKSKSLLVAAAMICGLGAFGVNASESEKPKVAAEETSVKTEPQAVPKAQKVELPGVALVNPDKADEAILLVQVAQKSPDGKIVPQLIGVKINSDATGKKLIKEYGVTSAKPGDVEGAKAVQKKAQENFVMVSGVIDFTTGRPVITVTSYKSAKEMLAKAKEQAKSPSASPKAQAN